jgi:competence protein ComEC
VAVASAGTLEALLTADAESPVLRALPLGAVDVLKVSHHGSADPGLAEVLRRVRPAEAVISVGANGYGHPHASTLAALKAAGVAVRRTDLEGDVTLAGPSGAAATMNRP